MKFLFGLLPLILFSCGTPVPAQEANIKYTLAVIACDFETDDSDVITKLIHNDQENFEFLTDIIGNVPDKHCKNVFETYREFDGDFEYYCTEIFDSLEFSNEIEEFNIVAVYCFYGEVS